MANPIPPPSASSGTGGGTSETRERTQLNPVPRTSLGPGRTRQRAWEALRLLKGLESDGASACSLPQWASWTDNSFWPPHFSAPCRVTSPPPSPRSLQTSPSLAISQRTHPFRPPSRARTGQHVVDVRLLQWTVPSASAAPLSPPAPSLRTLTLPCFWLRPQSWWTGCASVPVFSPVSSYLPWLFHSVLFPDTHLSNSPCSL